MSSKTVHCLSTFLADWSPSGMSSLAKMSQRPSKVLAPRCCRDTSCCTGMPCFLAVAAKATVIGSTFAGMQLTMFARGFEMQARPTSVCTSAAEGLPASAACSDGLPKDSELKWVAVSKRDRDKV